MLKFVHPCILKKGQQITHYKVLSRLFRLLVQGNNYTTAAAELKVSVNAIKFHMKNIYERMQVHSKSEAIANALQNRIVK